MDLNMKHMVGSELYNLKKLNNTTCKMYNINSTNKEQSKLYIYNENKFKPIVFVFKRNTICMRRGYKVCKLK